MKQFSLKYIEVILGILLVLSSALLFSCSFISSDTLGQATQNRKPIESSLDTEAKNEAEKMLNKYFIQHGDSYFTYEYHKVVYYRSASFSNSPPPTEEIWLRFAGVSPPEVHSLGVQDADRRNGIEWQGYVTFQCKSEKSYVTGGGRKESLSDWADCNYVPMMLVRLIKSKMTGWKVANFFEESFEVKRRLSFNPLGDGAIETDAFTACSEEDRRKILANGARYSEIQCWESGYKKIDYSEIPNILLK